MNGWRPICTAPEGVRVLLGPRDKPVVGIVTHYTDETDYTSSLAQIVHYNDDTFVTGYHCSEWHTLPTN